MSPRAMDYGMRAPAPAPSPIALTSHQQQPDYPEGHGRGQHGRRRKQKKPLSSGFKAIVWTSPPPVGLPSTSTSTSTFTSISTSTPPATGTSSQSPRAAPLSGTLASSNAYVEPLAEDRRRSKSLGGMGVPSPRGYAPKAPRQARRTASSGHVRAVDRTEAEAAAGVRQEQQQRRPGPNPAGAGAGAKAAEKEKRTPYIGTTRSEEFGDRLSMRALQHLPPPAAVEGTGIDISASRSLPHVLPGHSRRPSVTDARGNVVVERSLSDTSIVTASDFGGPKPTIIAASQMTDEDAIEKLEALLAKGKGLPVVKHATGMGGGKSRKLLKLNQQGAWYLALCGMLPPYFKTKIPVQDVDRVETKWCCVVVHARGRSPLRLEVDSFSTADTLRLGLMAASKIEPPSPPTTSAGVGTADQHQQPAGAGAGPIGGGDSRRGAPQEQEGLTLSSVRPGHRSSQVYDPDAALSVAALLAKEMEEERQLASQGGANGERGVWASARHTSRPEASPPEGRAAQKPLLKRSASMNSMVSSRLAESKAAAPPPPPPPPVDPDTNRRSLPRGYGGPMIAPGAGGGEELVVVDAKASLRRLYDAIEGRGMAAIKRNPNGKGRSRVVVRSRIKDNTIGWAHVLPPFTRKWVNVRELVGAQRKSRVVTVMFKTREPVMFETDKLTDALILEQGFVSLATLRKTEATRR